MKYKFVISQIALFAGLFLLLNFLLFIPDYYSVRFDSQICEGIDDTDFSSGDLQHSEEYYDAVCSSAIDGWKQVIELPATIRYHLVPVMFSGMVTAIYSYYVALDMVYRPGRKR